MGQLLDRNHLTLRRLLKSGLAFAGLFFFFHLVRASGASFDMIKDFGWTAFLTIVALFMAIIVLDTLAWKQALSHVCRPHFGQLLLLRIAGDALQNALPGGVVLGEAYKATMVRKFFGVSLADNITVLLMVKFGLALTQALFVLGGALWVYQPLRQNSVRLFGYPGAHHWSLILLFGMMTGVIFAIFILTRKDALTEIVGALTRLPSRRLRAFLEAQRPSIVRFSQSVDTFVRGQDHAHTTSTRHHHLLLAFTFLYLGWLVTTFESYYQLHFQDIEATVGTAYTIESLGSLFRLVFFMVPSGIGGQDASYLALFRLFHLPREKGGIFVVLKRLKEITWIGIGFLVIPLLSRSTVSAIPEGVSRRGLTSERP